MSPAGARSPGPRKRVNRGPRAPGSAPPSPADERLALPHERDEDTDMTDGEVDPVIEQAAKDIARGLVDTDMRATPGLDAEKRLRDVPGPGGRPPGQDDGQRRR